MGIAIRQGGNNYYTENLEFYEYGINCIFNNNYGQSGGAIYNGKAVNSTFIKNTVNNNGGAIEKGTAINCDFIGNFANRDGGALCGVNAINSTFRGNSAINLVVLYLMVMQVTVHLLIMGHLMADQCITVLL